MSEGKFNQFVDALKEFEGVEEVFLLSSDGEVICKSGNFPLTNEDAKSIIKAWKEKEHALMFQKLRYAILKNDDIQLAAKNIAQKKGNVIGSITKEGDYLLAHTRDEGMILLEWSIAINKIAWGQ